MNVVTTLPSATEVVAALEIEPVGVSHECDYPPDVTSVPVVTSSRIDSDASSAEIDRQVLEAAADDGPGVYDVDRETLESLDPDLIVTQGICDVCAVDEVVIERAVTEIDADPEILATDPHTIGDVLEDVRRVGRATGREDRAESVVDDLESRIETVRARAAVADDRPRVAIFDWTEPAMIAGHWMPELVEAAGGEYGMADPADRSRPREWEAVREYDPEVIVVAPCGFGLEQTAANLTDLTDREGWDDLAAVREGRVWAMDGHHYVNRPGPRLVDTLEALAPIVHPDPDLFEDPPESIARPLADLETLEGADRRGRLESQ
ncbi:ABC transporter substrate-binding protein [Natronoglomus mannanivorans]|uniref:ABC transporter substrate-binding protein n=1 Tax=Natronoglomus mannanivorans TaxID=2979990 RepID=A0AAP2Z2V7_9EURY|nr:ABC transporter substrate-binding protein [Halobacteria archaeon AArc-xg1-1]